MVLPAVMAGAKLASMAGGASKLAGAASGASKLAGIQGKLNSIRTAPVGSGDSTRGQILGGYAMWIGLTLLFLLVVGYMFWRVFIKEPRISPTPMNNTRVSNRKLNNEHQEFMFSNNVRHRNNYKRMNKKMSGGNDFGGYYGIHPRGFSQGESRKAPMIGQTSQIDPTGGYYGIYPSGFSQSESRKTNVVGQNIEIDPSGEEEEEYAGKIEAMETRRQKRLSKSMKNGVHNTGHIQQVSEINAATNLSSVNDFTSAFSRNSGERNIQRYIQPLEPRGISSDMLNFVNITK